MCLSLVNIPITLDIFNDMWFIWLFQFKCLLIINPRKLKLLTQSILWYAEPMLVYCWASVANGEPILNQHWLNVSHFLEVFPPDVHCLGWVFMERSAASYTSSHITYESVVAKSLQVLLVKQAPASSSKLHFLAQCCINIGTSFATLKQV